jgi:hypothetical protein
VKGFACKYGTDLSFVPPQSGLVSGGSQAYANITVSRIAYVKLAAEIAYCI